MAETGFADLYKRFGDLENKVDELFDGLFKRIDELYGKDNKKVKPPPKPKPPTAILIKEGDLGPKKEK